MTTEAPAPDPDAVKRHRLLYRAIKRRTQPKIRRSDITVTDEATVRRATKAAALGNAMEWFDFGIFAYLVVTIGHVFFPGEGATQLLAAFTTFAASFLVRPLGGLFFGPLGDRIGRKKVLALTMILMAVGTFCIGLLPGYASIGIAAPILLLVCRMVQGFSTGGEYGGAATFIAEYAPDKKRGFFGSYLEFGTLAGYTGAAGLILVLNTTLGTEAMESWGWRIPFLIGGPIGLVGLYLRMKLEETPAFQKLAAEQAAKPKQNEKPQAGENGEETAPVAAEHAPQQEFKTIFAKQWRTLLICIGLVAAYNICHYMLTSYMPAYLTEELGYENSMELIAAIIAMVAMMLVIHRVGRLSDRRGRKPVLMAGMAGFLLLTVPAFWLFQQGSFVFVLLGLMILGACLVCLLGAMSATLPALFPTNVRYGGLSIGYNIAVSIFGGTAPTVMTYLVNTTGDSMAPAYYVSAAGLVGMITVLCLKETAQQPLAGSPPAVATQQEAEDMARAQKPEPTF
ncbi:MFS transporter [Streptomyces sp. HNM0574]|uniref:MFS transporter n=1 Tax=Streptomyces sp. HNM0574 TaxID=2714954 RepID=UPI001469EFED|nr:MFS transporter [Streptomyces sp. HNM0574]NLU66535.1 MFS transporter [Streptomyces sp. HNM0574]